MLCPTLGRRRRPLQNPASEPGRPAQTDTGARQTQRQGAGPASSALHPINLGKVLTRDTIQLGKRAALRVRMKPSSTYICGYLLGKVAAYEYAYEQAFGGGCQQRETETTNPTGTPLTVVKFLYMVISLVSAATPLGRLPSSPEPHDSSQGST